MKLPKVKHRKLLGEDFIEMARKAKESFDEQDKYLREQQLKYGHIVSINPPNYPRE